MITTVAFIPKTLGLELAPKTSLLKMNLEGNIHAVTSMMMPS